MQPIRFTGNFRLVKNGLPVTDYGAGRQAVETLQNLLWLNGATTRLGKASFDILSWQGKRPANASPQSDAEEFRVFTDTTLNDLKAKKVSTLDLLAQTPDGDIEITRLLNPAIAEQIFLPLTYQLDKQA